ncbi:dnaj-like-2 isoform a-related [Holotrichia oblita]|uniref:Dnaj-like-2 isoform a-related n=1 Tax=Holotrichia oblita TaxID=644536 RepID=A0ACB9SZT8_HOLOL|nr:dnaj-like-2 isoform a-related [Holotrichia oblita]
MSKMFLMKKSLDIAEKVGVELSVPRVTQKQVHGSNPPSESAVEYWKRSIIIPYLDSLTSSLNARFSNENTPAFALTYLHPPSMLKMTSKDFKNNAESFMEFYKLGDVTAELDLWYDMWKKKNLAKDKLKNIEVAALLEEANVFFPCNKACTANIKCFSIHYCSRGKIVQYPTTGKNLAQENNR